MARTKQYMGLDIGTVRTGVAIADSGVRIAIPLESMVMDEATFADDVVTMVKHHAIDVVVVGYPRNQSGEPTAQTSYVEKMTAGFESRVPKVVFQDESLTSVMARERLGNKKAQPKGNIDAEAAAILLQDYLEHSV